MIRGPWKSHWNKGLGPGFPSLKNVMILVVTVTSILVFRAGEVDPQAFLLLFCLDVFFYSKAEALIFEVFQEAWQEVWQNMLKHVEAVVFAEVQFTSIQALPASMAKLAKRLFLFGGLHFCYSIKSKPISYYIGLVRNYIS